MAKKTKKSSGASAGRKKKKKGGSRLRRVLLVLVLLAAVAGIGWFFRDAFGAFGDRVKERLSETRQKLPTVTITAAPAAPENGSAALPAASTPAQAQKQLIGRIVEVMDGDTLTVSSGDNTFKVRLYGVDAPEVLQDYGIVARDILRDKVLDGEAEFSVVFVRDGLYYSRVSYDGRDINYEMVRDGHAWYDRQNAPGETALETAQNAAQRAKLGLWSVKSPTPPWEFRKRNR